MKSGTFRKTTCKELQPYVFFSSLDRKILLDDKAKAQKLYFSDFEWNVCISRWISLWIGQNSWFQLKNVGILGIVNWRKTYEMRAFYSDRKTLTRWGNSLIVE